ncbi:hypothetical protein BsWGS_23686 [Bradybaena similaris]
MSWKIKSRDANADGSETIVHIDASVHLQEKCWELFVTVRGKPEQNGVKCGELHTTSRVKIKVWFSATILILRAKK